MCWCELFAYRTVQNDTEQWAEMYSLSSWISEWDGWEHTWGHGCVTKYVVFAVQVGWVQPSADGRSIHLALCTLHLVHPKVNSDLLKAVCSRARLYSIHVSSWHFPFLFLSSLLLWSSWLASYKITIPHRSVSQCCTIHFCMQCVWWHGRSQNVPPESCRHPSNHSIPNYLLGVDFFSATIGETAIMGFNYTNMNPKNYPIRKKNESAKLFSVMVKKRHIFLTFAICRQYFWFILASFQTLSQKYVTLGNCIQWALLKLSHNQKKNVTNDLNIGHCV